MNSAQAFDTFADWRAELIPTLRSAARAYADLQHAPQLPNVARAYSQLASELEDQFRTVAARYTVLFVDADPYANSRELFADMDSGILRVYTGGSLPADHPFALRGAFQVPTNYVFRAVHDALAHYAPRNGFGMRGEYRAFRAHADMLSPLAVQALATETLGQNAYYHFGTISRTFAEQKAGILPAFIIKQALSIEDI